MEKYEEKDKADTEKGQGLKQCGPLDMAAAMGGVDADICRNLRGNGWL
jgi:hypothetical protein